MISNEDCAQVYFVLKIEKWKQETRSSSVKIEKKYFCLQYWWDVCQNLKRRSPETQSVNRKCVKTQYEEAKK